MTAPYTKTELITRLMDVQRGVVDSIQGMSAESYAHETETKWSPAGYLKHLLLSNKPFIKALGFSKEQLERLFGVSAGSSRPYDEVVTIYTQKLADGARAEDFPKVTPVAYRMPEDVTDERAYLVESWNTTHQNLYNTLESWSEEDLDHYQMLHPAIGVITVREMLFFTLSHNTLHWNDIQRGAA